MTLVEGNEGVIVIDPLTCEEVSAAAIALYRKHRGNHPVTAIIYTHSHTDHFGGVLGIVDFNTRVPIYAPEHFLEHVVAETVYAGTAMIRRAYYYTAAKEYFDKGDLRFAAELSSHAVFANRDNVAARNLLASVLERLGFGSEVATWRNCHLQGAHELRTNKVGHTYTNSDGMAPALTTTQWFDSLGIRVNGPKAWSHKLSTGTSLTRSRDTRWN
jgi:alkyl sulfatase BDS1-like metallo-beta-lactamase superfamily hydrolase